MGGAMAQIRSEGGPIQSIDPPLSTGHTVQIREDMMEYKIELTDPIPQTPHDSPLLGGHTPGSDEGSMTQKELTDLCTTLLQKVIDLENVKTAQAKEIASLKKRVTKLEQRQSSRISGFHPLGRRKVSKKERKNLKSQQKFQDIDDLLDKGRFTHAQLKSRSFEEIQKLYIKEHKWVDAFVPIGFEKDEKRIRSRKKRAVVLDRQDVLDLHKIIMERFLDNDPEGYDLILWGDLKTLVESSEDDEI
nr:hypothetical protein [Tanacetum cinerariifolium]